MPIIFKPMIETYFGSRYDFMALAKMDYETAATILINNALRAARGEK